MNATVRFFIPCYVDELWPEAARAAVELAEAVGFRVTIADAVCCGQALDNSGEASEGDRIRSRLMADSSIAGADELVVLSASCAGHLIGSRSAGAAEPRVREWCDWFVDYAPDEFPTVVERRVALHSSCSALRTTRSAGAARDLLARVRGLHVAEPASAEECCGFGGSFSTEFAELSIKMGLDKVAALRASDTREPDAIVSADCSCLLHLRALRSHELACFHVAEILRQAA